MVFTASVNVAPEAIAPELTPLERRRQMLTTTIAPETDDRLRRYAASSKRKLSSIVDAALGAYLESLGA